MRRELLGGILLDAVGAAPDVAHRFAEALAVIGGDHRVGGLEAGVFYLINPQGRYEIGGDGRVEPTTRPG